MEKTRKTYSQEFKMKTLELCRQRGSKSEVAKELGLRTELVYKWEDSYRKGRIGLTEPPVRNKLEDENMRLRKALKEAEMERDILKKAVCIFTKSDQ